MRHKMRPSRVSSIAAPTAAQLHRRARDPAPVLATFVSNGDEALSPMGRVGCRDSRGRDEVEIFSIYRGAAGPVVGAHQCHRVVDHHRFGVREPRLSVDPDRHTRSDQGSTPLVAGHGVVLSAINRTSTPRPLAPTSASTMPEPVVRP
jgi:hypothetical protein